MTDEHIPAQQARRNAARITAARIICAELCDIPCKPVLRGKLRELDHALGGKCLDDTTPGTECTQWPV